MPYTRPHDDINNYIGDCKKKGMEESEVWKVMDDNMSGLEENIDHVRGKSGGSTVDVTGRWHWRFHKWTHVGWDGWGELKYQGEIKNILQRMREKEGAAFHRVHSCRGIIPL